MAARLTFQSLSRISRLTFYLTIELLWYFNANLFIFFSLAHSALAYLFIDNCGFKIDLHVSFSQYECRLIYGSLYNNTYHTRNTINVLELKRCCTLGERMIIIWYLRQFYRWLSEKNFVEAHNLEFQHEYWKKKHGHLGNERCLVTNINWMTYSINLSSIRLYRILMQHRLHLSGLLVSAFDLFCWKI